MDCDAAKGQLGLLMDGELLPERATAVEDHLRACPACSREWASLRALNDRLSDAAALEKTGVPAELWPAIERRLARAEARGGLERKSSVFRRPLAMAASLALVVGTVVFVALVLDRGMEDAQAAVVDYSVLLDGLTNDVDAAIERFLDYYHAEPIPASDAREAAPKLSFDVPPELSGGFHLVQAYRLKFGPSPGVAARYQRNAEPLVVFFHPVVRDEHAGKYAQLPCIVGGRHGHQVEIGPWRLLHVMDATTCHCILSKLDPPSELPPIIQAIAPDTAGAAWHHQ